MVSKANATKGSVQAIDYIMKDEKDGFELCRNDLIGCNGQEILAEFREVQLKNPTCINNTFSIVLSPNNDRIHSEKELLEYTKKHLQNLGLSEHQYIAHVHRNTKTTHIHIIANRVNYQGKAINDSYIGYKAQNSAEKIAKSYGYKTSKELRVENNQYKKLDHQKFKEIQKDILQKHQEVIKTSKNFEDYMVQMNQKGIKIEPRINQKAELYDFKIYDKKNEIFLKPEQIDSTINLEVMKNNGMDFKNLEVQLKNHIKQPLEKIELSKDLKPEKIFDPKLNNIRSEIYKAHNFSVKSSPTFKIYIKEMKTKGYQIEPIINRGGKLQGFKIHDFKNKTSYKASEIHKNCSLNKMKIKGMDFNNLNNQLEEQLKEFKIEIPNKPIELVKNIPSKSSELYKEIKNEVIKNHQNFLKTAPNFANYIIKMNEKGFQIQPIFNKNNEFFSFKIYDPQNNITFKIEEISPNGLKNMLENGMNFNQIDLQLTSCLKDFGKEFSSKPIELISNLKPLLKLAKIGFSIIKNLIQDKEQGISM